VAAAAQPRHTLPERPFPLAQGYVEAARMFEQESGTSPGLNLDAITDRMEVRKAVQSGQVELAVEKVNDLDPEVGAAQMH
jgi:hypothetical protein